MAATIAMISVVYCLLLCAFASALSARVKSHQALVRCWYRAAGVFLIGFGVRLASQ